MLNNEISNKILTIGCSYIPPKGGVAQVIYNYSSYVFPTFKCIVNSSGGNKLKKTLIAIIALLKTVFVLTLNKSIKIVHIHTASYNSFTRSALFVQIAKIFHKKVILHIHGGGFKKYYSTKPQKITDILNKCDCIITLSKSWQSFFSTISHCKQIEIVNNIVAPPQFLHLQKDNKFHLLFLGLITEQKGIFDLLEVIAAHRQEFENKLTLHIGGNGKVEKLMEFIRTHGLQTIVVYEGWVSKQKKAELFNLANAFILPSYTEGLPVSILEAMSYGVPVIATKVGGIPEAVTKNTGILFTPGNKYEMQNILSTLISGEKQFEKQAIIQESQKYLPEIVSAQLNNTYKTLLK